MDVLKRASNKRGRQVIMGWSEGGYRGGKEREGRQGKQGVLALVTWRAGKDMARKRRHGLDR